MLEAFVEGVGIWAPGLAGWAAGSAVLRGDARHDGVLQPMPPIELLPPAERRRLAPTVKLAMTAALDAVGDAQADARTLASVFACSGGDGETIHQILLTLTSGAREVSPTRFHNSVHNAPSGYWAVATEARTPSTTVSAHDGSFVAGFIEAMTYVAVEAAPVLLVAYDQAYPEPLHSVRPLTSAFAAAFALSPSPTPRTRARLALTLEEGRVRETAMSDPALEALRVGNPAGRALPLLEVLAQGHGGRVLLEGTGADHLAIAVTALGRGVAAC